MKRSIAKLAIFGSLAATLALTATLALAQATSDVVEITRDDIQTGRKEILANTMEFTEAEGTAFWPVYNAYRLEIRKVDDKLIKVIMDFADSYESLTDVQAETMVKDLLAARQEKAKIAAAYLKKFTKVIPPKKTARFYQVENRMDLIVQIAAAAEIPLVK